MKYVCQDCFDSRDSWSPMYMGVCQHAERHVCSRCGEAKPADKFPRRGKRGRLANVCTDCAPVKAAQGGEEPKPKPKGKPKGKPNAEPRPAADALIGEPAQAAEPQTAEPEPAADPFGEVQEYAIRFDGDDCQRTFGGQNPAERLMSLALASSDADVRAAAFEAAAWSFGRRFEV